MRSSDCGAPGRSTTTMRGAVAPRLTAAGATAAPPGPCQPPKTASTSLRSEMPVRSPATTSVLERWVQQRRVACRDGRAVKPGNGLLGARKRTTVGCIVGEDELRKEPFDTSPGVCPHLQQVVDALLAEALDLILRKAGLEGDLGQQAQGRRQPRPRHLDRYRQGVPAGIRGELRAESLGRLDERHRVALQGALGHGASHHHRHAALRRRLTGSAAAALAAHQQLRHQQAADRARAR